MKDFQRFEVRRCQVFKIWDNHKQEFWRNGPEDANYDMHADAEKLCFEMNEVVKNLQNFNPNAVLGRPRKKIT